MAVLKQDLLRSTFQERQITLLTQLSKDISKSANTLSTTQTFISGRMLSSIDEMFSKLARSINSTYMTGTSSYVRGLRNLESAIDKSGRRTSREFTEALEEDAERRKADAEKYKEALKEREDHTKETVDQMTTMISRIFTGIDRTAKIFGLSWSDYTTGAAKFSELTNTLVINTNATRSNAEALRDSIIGSVDSLNKRYDNIYNAQDSYATIVTLANQTGIKQLEFYEEYGEMFLQTQKTMNMNLATLAEFSDKFYRRYNFSSSTMQELTESIRVNTAGSSVSEDEMLAFMQTMDPDLWAYSIRMGGNAEANYAQLQNNMTGIYSWLDTQGYDANQLLSMITGAASGGVSSSEYGVLAKLGMNLSPDQLMTQLLNNPAPLMSELISRLGGLNLVGAGGNGRYMAGTYGVDYGTAVLAQYKGLDANSYYEYMNNRPASEDPNIELYVSAEQKTANSVEHMAVLLSDIQEDLGINFTTLTDIYNVLTGVIGKGVGDFAASALGNFLGQAFVGKLVSGGGFGSLLGSGSLLAKGLGVGATVAGVALIVDTFYHLYSRYKEQEYYNDQVNQEASSAIATGNYLAVNPDGTVSQTSDSRALGNIHDIEQSAVDRYSNNLGVIEQGAQWVATNILGYSQEGLALGQVPDATANKWKVALVNTASKEAEKGNDLLLRMLQAYTNKNLLKDPWMWEWLAGSPTYGTSNLADALKSFEDKRTLISPWKTIFGGVRTENIPAYRMGTNYVSGDQLALVHEGEAIIPASSNPFTKYSRAGSTDYLNSIAKYTKESSDTSSEYGPYIQEISETLAAIKEFMSFWRLDNLERESIRDITNTAKSTNLKLSLVTGSSSVATDTV